MTALDFILDGLEAELALERELGVRSFECDRSLLECGRRPESKGEEPPAAPGARPDVPPRPASPAPSSPPPRPAPPPRRPDAAVHPFVFLHHAPLSRPGAEMMAKVAVFMGQDPVSAPVVTDAPLPQAKVYVVLGSQALRKWFPGIRAGNGMWFSTGDRGVENAVVTRSPDLVLARAGSQKTLRELKEEMKAVFISAMQRIRL